MGLNLCMDLFRIEQAMGLSAFALLPEPCNPLHVSCIPQRSCAERCYAFEGLNVALCVNGHFVDGLRQPGAVPSLHPTPKGSSEHGKGIVTPPFLLHFWVPETKAKGVSI